MDETLRRALTAHEAIRRQLEPLSAQFEALQRDLRIRNLIADADCTRTLRRAALGPVEDLRRSLQINALSSVAKELEVFRNLGVEIEKQFHLPQLSVTTKLLQELERAGSARTVAHYRDHKNQLHRAFEAMTTPWLNTENQLQSLAGFVGLQQIGHILRTKSRFDVELAEQLRPHLGDWQTRIDWPKEIFTDPLARSDFYVERGLDPDLTDFPASAFGQAITIAGIKSAPAPFIRAYDYEPDHQLNEEEAGFERTNDAHDRLQRFESHVRAFIDQRMTDTVCKNWIKHRIPGEMRQQWSEKQAKARDEGESEQPLIAYADFTDYVKIIVRKDNWDEAFAPVFRRKSLVEESFQRLYPIRVCTMHSRIITQDDELYLHSETRRLLKAMDIET